VRGTVRQARTLQQSLTDKKAAAQAVTKADWTQALDLFNDASNANDQLEQRIDGELPGATGERQKELQAGKNACGRLRQTLRAVGRFIEELKR
jgi:hypothetical protein